MGRSNPTTVALASDYIESHGAESDCPERELWRAVLRQAAEDVLSTDEEIRADAVSFFRGPDLLRVLNFAGIDRNWAATLTAKALELAEASQEQRQRCSRFITHQGQTRSLTEWSEISGVHVATLHCRLRLGWPVERALTTPGRQQTTTD